MDAHGLSVLSHLRAKPVGKVRRRVLELRTSTSSYYYGGGGGGGGDLPTLDLSHSESQRLAVDALLGAAGVPGYREQLAAEGEVDFLSEREKRYILTHRRAEGESDAVDGEEDHCGGGGGGGGGSQDCGGALSLGHFSASEESSDDSQTPEPSLHPGSQDGVQQSGADPPGRSRVEVFLQSDNREGSMKDLIREQIRKTQTALVVVVDTFSDVELLCDILEASLKRNVCVSLLLDHLNVQEFLDMCLDLNVDGKHFPRLCVRSVGGPCYCAKTGRKFSGQVTEAFIISDWTQVLTGTYSFSWLSWQVNRNFIVLLEGSWVTSFHQEFRRLYLSSQPVPPLFRTALTPTPTPSPASHVARKNNNNNTSDDTSAMASMLKRRRRRRGGGDRTQDGKGAAEADVPADVEPAHMALSRLEVERNRAETYVMTLAQWQAPTQADPPTPWKKREIPLRLRSDVNTLAFARMYKHNQTGMDTLKTPMNPHASTVAGGLLYQEFASRNGRAAAHLDTLSGRAQRSDPRLRAGPPPLLRRSLSLQTRVHGDAQGLYVRAQRQWLAVGQPSPPQSGACLRTQPPQQQQQRLVSSHRPHLWPGAAAANPEMPSFSPDAGTDLKSQLESGFFSAAAGTKAAPRDLQSNTCRQPAPSQRLLWISQMNARSSVRNASGGGANGTGGRRMGEGQRGGRPAMVQRSNSQRKANGD
ncbi:Protein FAM83A [Merluccius polli]|uniref:Protein FAM83A n=1 Tax=Merluccius polli TaxID=89951 RepID=A0AA47PCJ7_MERPO|nr:Protein FAM83A [Merluccius polli]